MAKGKTVVQIKNNKNSLDLYIKAPFVETFFKSQSKDGYGEPKLKTCNDAAGETIYSYYVLRTLPNTPYSLQATQDLFNAFGFLRAKGIGRGLRIPLTMPLTYDMAKDLVDRVCENVRHIYSLYCDKFTVERVFITEEAENE